ncbi:MAG: hypothetical protein ACOWYE_01765 [Desulfatiglandales bacterium]
MRGRGLGAVYLGNDRCRFPAWAPGGNESAVRILSPKEQISDLDGNEKGYFHAVVEVAPPTVRTSFGWIRMDSSDERWAGPGSTSTRTNRFQGEAGLALPPTAFALFSRV